MARPTRQGVDYFPLDIHLDDKFKFIQIKYGLEGFAVVVKLLQKIYSYGYWYQWGEDESLIFAHENAVEMDKLNNIIEETIKRGIFHEGIYSNYQVLTSSGIQKRYKEIVKRRKDVEIVTEYLLLDNNFGVSTIIEPTECIHDDNIDDTECIHDEVISAQSKVDKSKVDKSKVEKPVESKFNEATIEYQLSESLYKKILINDNKAAEPNLHKWAENIDKLIRIDKRTVEEIELVINYVTTDSFEMANVLSTSKLRSRFPQLYMKAKQGGSHGEYRASNKGVVSEIKGARDDRAERAGVVSL